MVVFFIYLTGQVQPYTWKKQSDGLILIGKNQNGRKNKI